jgi:hypothetical protein
MVSIARESFLRAAEEEKAKDVRGRRLGRRRESICG